MPSDSTLKTSLQMNTSAGCPEAWELSGFFLGLFWTRWLFCFNIYDSSMICTKLKVFDGSNGVLLIPLGIRCSFKLSVRRHGNSVPSQTFQRWKHFYGSGTLTFKEACVMSLWGSTVKSKVTFLLLRNDFWQSFNWSRPVVIYASDLKNN